MAKNNLIDNPTITRWNPDFRYRKDKFVDVELKNFKSNDDSITDKEAYRVTLSSLRGELASMSGGSAMQGSYSIPAGEDFDFSKDFSFLNRPDLTIVELDEYIERFKARLEASDKALTADIENQLQLLANKKNELSKQITDKEKEE